MFEVRNHILFRDGISVPTRPSRNYTRGVTIEPRIIIIHYDGVKKGTGGLEWLTDPTSKVSAHLWIARNGHVVQILPFNLRAWHAGDSEWDGEPNCNSYSIGIENEGDGTDWPEAQIKALIEVVIALKEHYHTVATVGHEDVAPERKVDPGPNFPWDRLERALNKYGF